jgi:hypothetical protein
MKTAAVLLRQRPDHGEQALPPLFGGQRFFGIGTRIQSP